MQEYIPGYERLSTSFSPENPALKMLSAFQHFVYLYTHGQMTLTKFKGNPPLITNPKVLDLNPAYVFHFTILHSIYTDVLHPQTKVQHGLRV